MTEEETIKKSADAFAEKVRGYVVLSVANQIVSEVEKMQKQKDKDDLAYHRMIQRRSK